MRLRTHGILALSAASLALAVFAGCAGNSPIDLSPPGSPTPATLSGGVLPALGSFTPLSCTNASCHGNATRSAANGDFSLAGSSQQAWVALLQTTGLDHTIVVNTGNPAISELLTKPDSSSSVTHTGGKTFWNSASPNSQYQTVLSWIQAGAKDN